MQTDIQLVGLFGKLVDICFVMIQIGLQFIRAFSPNEQLIMLQLLLHADEDGVVEFSDRGVSRLTEIPYQQVRTIHQKWLSDGIITNAAANASTNAKQRFVTICDYDSYNVVNIFSNAVSNAVTNALKEVEIIKDKEKDFPHTPLQRDIENNEDEEDIKEEDSKESKKKKFVYPQEYENDFILYGRKGSKKNGFKKWKELTEEEKVRMRLHIPYYLQSNDRQFLKDFEGYINQRMFESPVYQGSILLYDPMQREQPEGYHPLTDNCQIWEEKNQCLRIFNGDIDNLNDGYTDGNRPEGATVAWGMYSWKWSKLIKEWVKQ